MSATSETAGSDAGVARSFRVSDVLIVCAGVLVLFALIAAAASARPAPTVPGDPLDPRTYEPKSKVFLELHAAGVQKYTCQANGTWLFTDPEATLYKPNGSPKADGTHFLNFATGRPVWRFKDGSSVEAARKVSVPAGSANIAMLLLEAVPMSDGGDGDKLERATWVQRLNTSGGVAPTTPCTPGATLAAPYTADYFFWRASGGWPAGRLIYVASTTNVLVPRGRPYFGRSRVPLAPQHVPAVGARRELERVPGEPPRRVAGRSVGCARPCAQHLHAVAEDLQVVEARAVRAARPASAARARRAPAAGRIERRMRCRP